MKTVLIIIYVIVALVLTVLTLMQSKDDDGMSAAITGGSGTITGSSTNNFYEQNKGRTKEGKLRRNTIILGVAFIVLAIVLGIFY